ncbi:hypothetical protein CSA57_14660 [candidate division KSB3 bacterium]|nr:MAG: hypothetical protein CSA57_14660 [candidate division KSB3 bacterium]
MLLPLELNRLQQCRKHKIVVFLRLGTKDDYFTMRTQKSKAPVFSSLPKKNGIAGKKRLNTREKREQQRKKIAILPESAYRNGDGW